MTKFTKLLMSTMLLIASTACEPAPTGNPYTSDSDDSDTEQGDDDSTTNDSTTGDSATGGN